MHDDGIVDEIADMIRNVKKNDDLAIDAQTHIDTLGIDSLDFVEILFSMEERFDVDIDFNANTDGSFPFATVGGAADAVRALVAGRSAAA